MPKTESKLNQLILIFTVLLFAKAAMAQEDNIWNRLDGLDDPAISDQLDPASRSLLDRFSVTYANGSHLVRKPTLRQENRGPANLLQGDVNVLADARQLQEINVSLNGDTVARSYSRAAEAVGKLELQLLFTNDAKESARIERLLVSWRNVLKQQSNLLLKQLTIMPRELKVFYFTRVKEILSRHGILTVDANSEEFQTKFPEYLTQFYNLDAFTLRVPLTSKLDNELGSAWAAYVKAAGLGTAAPEVYEPSLSGFKVKPNEQSSLPFAVAFIEQDTAYPDAFWLSLKVRTRDLANITIDGADLYIVVEGTADVAAQNAVGQSFALGRGLVLKEICLTGSMTDTQVSVENCN